MVAVAPVLDLSLHRLLESVGSSPPVICSRTTLRHLSSILEQQVLKRQIPALLLVGFQDAPFWENWHARHGRLAGASRHTVIFSAGDPPARPQPDLIHVPLPQGEPLQQERFVVLLSPVGSLVVAAHALAEPGTGGEPLFSTVWGFLPAQIQPALDLLTQVLALACPEQLEPLRALIRALPLQAPDPQLMMTLFSEMLSFEERQSQQARAREQELAQQLRWREDVTATIVHDMRVPLQNLLMALDLLQLEQGAASLEVLELMAEARRDTHDLRAQIQLIADTQHLDARQFTLRWQPVIPERLVNDALAPLRHRIAQKQINLEISYDERVTVLWGDTHLLVRLLQNLLSNALKFTSSGGRIAVRVQYETEGSTLLQVSDSGDGITAAALPHIFERYYQAQPGDRRGTGLGLYFCRLVAEAHGGQVWAESQPGRGTTVSVQLGAPLTDLPPTPRR